MGEYIGVNPDLKTRFRQTPEHNFGFFVKDPGYLAANRALVREVFGFLPDDFINLDIGCGTGLVGQLAAEGSLRFGYRGIGLGIDPDTYIIQEASKFRYPDPDRYLSTFRVGYAADAVRIFREVFGERLAHWGSIHDAIHEIPKVEDRQEAFNQLALSVGKNGVVSYNSTFTTEAVGESSRDFVRLKSRAFDIFGRHRDKNIEEMVRLSAAAYLEMMKKTGLIPIYVAYRRVTLSLIGMVGILKYGPFLGGMYKDMEGVDDISVEELSEVGIRALNELSAERTLDFTRRFDEAIAQKPA